jgi:hypothetical protein
MNNNFKDFDIKPKVTSFVGDKLPVKKLLNAQITVLDFKVEPSKQKKDTECLTLQIIKAGDKRVVFTGSNVLIDQIRRVPASRFPFDTIIRNENDYYEFT